MMIKSEGKCQKLYAASKLKIVVNKLQIHDTGKCFV